MRRGSLELVALAKPSGRTLSVLYRDLYLYFILCQHTYVILGLLFEWSLISRVTKSAFVFWLSVKCNVQTGLSRPASEGIWAIL